MGCDSSSVASSRPRPGWAEISVVPSTVCGARHSGPPATADAAPRLAWVAPWVPQFFNCATQKSCHDTAIIFLGCKAEACRALHGLWRTAQRPSRNSGCGAGACAGDCSLGGPAETTLCNTYAIRPLALISRTSKYGCIGKVYCRGSLLAGTSVEQRCSCSCQLQMLILAMATQCAAFIQDIGSHPTRSDMLIVKTCALRLKP